MTSESAAHRREVYKRWPGGKPVLDPEYLDVRVFLDLPENAGCFTDRRAHHAGPIDIDGLLRVTKVCCVPPESTNHKHPNTQTNPKTQIISTDHLLLSTAVW